MSSKIGDERISEDFFKKVLDGHVQNTSGYTPVFFVRKQNNKQEGYEVFKSDFSNCVHNSPYLL